MVVLADGVWTGHMSGWWWVWMSVPFLAVVGFGFYLTHQLNSHRPEPRNALEILDERYARSEIDREVYIALKRDLEQ